MKCALCKAREANKKNTHYLTDGIIRSCLNIDGSNKRETAFYFDVSSGNPFIEFNFQRGTSVSKLEEALGREITEEEVERAKTIPFSVDYVFCKECEDIFTEIESEFIEKVLPSLRNSDLTKNSNLVLADNRLIRLFFYLQIWRSSICEDILKLSNTVSENLRNIILNYKTADPVNHFPISITYLETLGGEFEYTTNFVGFTSDQCPNIIFFNDFIIQFYESQEVIKFFDFYNLNSKETYKEFINYRESDFIVNIFHNEKRKQLLEQLIIAEKVKETIQIYRDGFTKLWLMLFGIHPPLHTTNEYLGILISTGEFNVLRYTRENITKMTYEFISNKIKM